MSAERVRSRGADRTRDRASCGPLRVYVFLDVQLQRGDGRPRRQKGGARRKEWPYAERRRVAYPLNHLAKRAVHADNISR